MHTPVSESTLLTEAQAAFRAARRALSGIESMEPHQQRHKRLQYRRRTKTAERLLERVRRRRTHLNRIIHS